MRMLARWASSGRAAYRRDIIPTTAVPQVQCPCSGWINWGVPMGTWGHGVLQNDIAQDGLCEVIESIYGDVIALGNEPTNRKTVARLGAGVGIMLQLSASYWFS